MLRMLHRVLKHGAFMALSVAGLWMVHALVPLAVLKSTNDVGGNFLQTFGGMYGIIVAFALYVVWQQNIDKQVALEREAVSLGELHRLLRHFSSWPGRDAARGHLREYVLAVPTNSRSASTARVDERALFGKVIDSFIAWNAPSPAEERLWTLALDFFHELNEAREHR